MTARSGRILFTCLILDLLLRLFALDDITISIANHNGPVIEGKSYELQCFLRNVTEIVAVQWYKGQNKSIFNETLDAPVNNKISKHQIRPDRDDDGAQYWCEAKLQNSSYTMLSKHLNITVNVKPIINGTKLPSIVPVFRGYPEMLVCEAEGKPKPKISWTISTGIINNETLIITESTPENVTCTATNSAGSDVRSIKVVLKEDYLPLIAGLVAITVTFISVIFVFIYSIYYKTAKMGRYSLKDAKPSAQNGNIAQNGKDSTIPMKKVSQSDILA